MNKTCKSPLSTVEKTGAILSFDSTLAVACDSCNCLISGYQEGSGTPAPDNVRNLVSFDECNVAKSGKNLLNDSVSNRTMDGKNIIFNGDSRLLSKCVYLKQGVTYTISIGLLDGTSTNIYITNSETGDGITGFPAYNVNSKTFTVSKDGYYCVWSYKADYTSVNSVSYCQIEIGSTFTTYDPYKGNTYTLSFGQSIYEGTIDFTTGVLTANRILVTLTGDSSESYALSASNRRINYSISGILLNSGVDDTVDGYLCNRFEQITPNQSYRTNMGFAVNTTNSVIFFNDGSGEMTVDGWRTWLASNNIQLVVMLATPLQIQLTPTEIQTIIGQNNIYADTGNTTIQYQDFPVAKKGNFREVFKLPIVTETKTGSILTFNSALPVVADDVTSLITGYQEGSGTPSPDNVRNLVSFDECNVSRTGINIWDEEVEEGYIYNGRYYASTSYKRTKNFVPVKAGETYRFIGFTTDGQINCFDEHKQYLRAFSMNNIFLYEMPERTCYIKFYNPNASFDSNCSINYPSSDTSYHSGKSNKYYTLSFGQSIYGGTIDFTTGVLTATKAAKVFNGSESWSLHPQIANWFSVDGQIEDAYTSATSADFANSNMYVQRRYDNASVMNDGQFAIGIPSGGSFVRLVVKDTNQATASDFKTFLNSNNLQIAYTLASPLEIQLTPTEISLLQGTNNLWSSTGNLTVQFKNVK